MELQNTASTPVNFKAQIQTQTSPIDKIKTKLNDAGFKKDGEMSSAETTATIVGISSAALLAILGFMNNKKTPTPQKITRYRIKNITKKSAQKAIQNAAQVPVKEAIQEATQTVVKNTSKTNQEVIENATNIAQQYKKGNINFEDAKKAVKRNLPKDQKKLAQEVVQEARLEKLAAEQSAIEASKVRVQDLNALQSQTKTVSTGIKNIADVENLQTRAAFAKQSTQEANRLANEAQAAYKANPTSKNKNLATQAWHKAEEVAKNEKIVAQKVETRTTQIQQEAAKKAENIAKMQASPNYQAGLEKQAQNAQKTQAKAIKRQAEKDMAKPGYQRALSELKNASKEKLESIIQNKKSNAIDVKVAQDLLKSMS